MPLQFSCQIESVKANRDRTLMVKLETQELGPEDTAKIFALMNMQMYAAMAEIPLRPEDMKVPKEAAKEFKKDKSPSERLRAKMYVYFLSHNGKGDGFNQWYEAELEKAGQIYLEKLH